MTFDRRDYAELTERRKQAAKGEELARTARLLEQSVVSAESLTNDPNWNVFLQYLQSDMKRWEGMRDGMLNILRDPTVVNHEQIIAAKIGYAEADGYIKALQAVIAKPKDIVDDGKDARALLGRLDEQSAA